MSLHCLFHYSMLTISCIIWRSKYFTGSSNILISIYISSGGPNISKYLFRGGTNFSWQNTVDKSACPTLSALPNALRFLPTFVCSSLKSSSYALTCSVSFFASVTLQRQNPFSPNNGPRPSARSNVACPSFLPLSHFRRVTLCPDDICCASWVRDVQLKVHRGGGGLHGWRHCKWRLAESDV